PRLNGRQVQLCLRTHRRQFLMIVRATRVRFSAHDLTIAIPAPPALTQKITRSKGAWDGLGQALGRDGMPPKPNIYRPWDGGTACSRRPGLPQPRAWQQA